MPDAQVHVGDRAVHHDAAMYHQQVDSWSSTTRCGRAARPGRACQSEASHSTWRSPQFQVHFDFLARLGDVDHATPPRLALCVGALHRPRRATPGDERRKLHADAAIGAALPRGVQPRISAMIRSGDSMKAG